MYFQGVSSGNSNYQFKNFSSSGDYHASHSPDSYNELKSYETC